MDKIAVNRTEAAKLLGVSLPTITRWVKSGQLQAFNSGGRILISVKALHKLVGDIINEPKPIDPQKNYYDFFNGLSESEQVAELKKLMVLM